jgi:4-aminobutyrate aminotransferase-like enzyme
MMSSNNNVTVPQQQEQLQQGASSTADVNLEPFKSASSSKEEAAAQKALAAAEARFVANNPISKKLHDLAVGSLPGGNTRTLLHTSPFPLCMKKGKGAFVWDEDGHK